MTANLADPRKRDWGYEPRELRKQATFDSVVHFMVASWDQEQRKRIRGILLALLTSYPQGTDLLATPEVAVVAMIDQESA